MAPAAVESLVQTLRQHRLLDAKQLAELAGFQSGFADPKALALLDQFEKAVYAALA